MIEILDKETCCGCSACKNICPKGAITMKPDGLGFIYPEVDRSICIECGLCNKVCAFNDGYDKSLNLYSSEAFAARHKNIKEVSTSRSGAAFIALSDWVLEQGGVIYGAGYTDHFRVVHKRAETKEQRNEFKGSKYVQSDLNDTFAQIKCDLLRGSIVLFSGTPCQTSGLSSFVGAELRKNLYLIDIVCHGVPSPFIWRDYLRYIESKVGEKVISVDFRDKSKLGWAAHKESFTFPSKKIYKQTYTYLFYEHIMFRPSCRVCHFTNLIRPSDITIADFWGWEKTDLSFNKDNKGVSLVFCNTEKGKDLFTKVSEAMNIIKTDSSKCLQPNLLRPSVFHPLSSNFEQDYIDFGFEYVARKYGDIGLPYLCKRLKQKSKTALKLILKK